MNLQGNIYNNLKQSNMMIELKSVGSIIDTDTRLVYTTLSNGYYADTGIDLYSTSKDWVDKLSDEDIYLINENI